MYKVLDNNERLFQKKIHTGTRNTVINKQKTVREVTEK